MSWKTDRVYNNITYINRINKVIFIQRDDTKYDYDDMLTLSFPKFKQEGSIDINNGVVTVSANTKVMIEINLLYRYHNAQYAPRYNLHIYKNDVMINTHYCGMNDSGETMNSMYIISVVDVKNYDVITIRLSKDTIEDSTNHIEIMKNSYINYKTF